MNTTLKTPERVALIASANKALQDAGITGYDIGATDWAWKPGADAAAAIWQAVHARINRYTASRLRFESLMEQVDDDSLELMA